MVTRHAVLVTGSTGFVGRHVTRELLARGHRVIALARSHPGRTAEERVARAVGLRHARALAVVEADLTEGMSPVVIGTLLADVATVVHCAGDTSFFPEDLDGFRRGLIDAPVELLGSLAANGTHRWVHMSTAFVCGRRTGRVLEDEADLGQTFRNAYEEAKLASEIAVRREGARRAVDVRIVRPSIVVGAGAETLGAHPSRLLLSLIRAAAAVVDERGIARLRIPVEPSARFHAVAVEDVAAVTAVIAQAPAAANGTFHAVVREPPTHAEVCRLVCAELGIHGVQLVGSEAAALVDPTPLEAGIVAMLTPYREYLEQDVTFEDWRCRAVREAYGVPAPRFDAAVAKQLVQLALDEAAIPMS